MRILQAVTHPIATTMYIPSSQRKQVLNLRTDTKEKKANEKNERAKGQNQASNQEFLGGDIHSFFIFLQIFFNFLL